MDTRGESKFETFGGVFRTDLLQPIRSSCFWVHLIWGVLTDDHVLVISSYEAISEKEICIIFAHCWINSILCEFIVD